MRIVVCWFSGLVLSVRFGAAQEPLHREKCSADTASGAESIRLYLSPIRIDSGYRLTPYGYNGATHVEQNPDFAARADSAGITSVIGAPTRKIDTWNAVQFVSPPLAGPFELGGFSSGRLDLISNKSDFDFRISLYELTPSGDYVLSSTFSTQATAPADLQHRTPLQLGIRQYRDYESACFPRRLVQNGSRLVVLVTILKPRGGADPVAHSDVDAGTSSDANLPLQVRWYGDSYIELHVRHH